MAPSSSKESPLDQLLASLRKEKYKFSKQEAEVLTKCNSRMKTFGLEGFLAAGSTVWAVTGSLTLTQRLTATLAGAAAGGMFLLKWSAGFCMEDILALEGSPLQETFAAILQKEAVHKPHIRRILEKYYYVEPLYDDSGQNTPGVVMRKRESAGVCIERNIREESRFDEDSGPSQNVERALTSPKDVDEHAVSSSKVHSSGNAHIHDEASEDPFDMLLGNEPTDEASSLSAVKGKAVEKRKDKMGVLERRERNRSRYLEWQEKRRTSGQEDALVEL